MGDDTWNITLQIPYRHFHCIQIKFSKLFISAKYNIKYKMFKCKYKLINHICKLLVIYNEYKSIMHLSSNMIMSPFAIFLLIKEYSVPNFFAASLIEIKLIWNDFV